MVFPGIHSAAFFIYVKQYGSNPFISARNNSFNKRNKRIVRAYLEFSPRKMLSDVIHFAFGLFFSKLFYALIRRMRFWNKGSDVYIALNVCFFLNFKQEFRYKLFFCLVVIQFFKMASVVSRWKANHKIKLSLVPAAFFRFHDDVNQLFFINFLVY